MVELVCPNDRTALRERRDGVGYDCPRCETSYRAEAGVIDFLQREEAFYEDHYAEWAPAKYVPRSERWFHAWPLWLIRSGYLWAVRKHVPPGRVVVEVGCAAGVTYFARRYRMVGMDVAQSTLRTAAVLYDLALKADITEPLPLPDGSVDAVINSFLWEHLPPDTKPGVLREWHRVLRPGGKIVLLYDVETRNPLQRSLKRRDPELYRELYIEREQHFGYQSPHENAALIRDGGFRLVEHRGKEKTWLQSPWEYDRIRQWEGWPARLAPIGLRFTRPPWLFGYTALVRVLDEALGPLLPLDWGRTVLTVGERT